MSPAPDLVIGIGNPSRGDDALGPLALERLAAAGLAAVEWLTDFQLQVEYVLDLAERRRVVFIDAAARGPAPYAFAPIAARSDASYTSHAMSPSALLAAYRVHHGHEPPPAWVLAIRGYGFELGQPLDPRAEDNLNQALAFLTDWLSRPL